MGLVFIFFGAVSVALASAMDLLRREVPEMPAQVAQHKHGDEHAHNAKIEREAVWAERLERHNTSEVRGQTHAAKVRNHPIAQKFPTECALVSTFNMFNLHKSGSVSYKDVFDAFEKTKKDPTTGKEADLTKAVSGDGIDFDWIYRTLAHFQDKSSNFECGGIDWKHEKGKEAVVDKALKAAFPWPWKQKADAKVFMIYGMKLIDFWGSSTGHAVGLHQDKIYDPWVPGTSLTKDELKNVMEKHKDADASKVIHADDKPEKLQGVDYKEWSNADHALTKNSDRDAEEYCRIEFK